MEVDSISSDPIASLKMPNISGAIGGGPVDCLQPDDATTKNNNARAKSATPNSASKKADLKVLADGKVMKVQKTRQRKILSCVYCHSKKIKCSRVQPICNNCEKLGIECKYFINERVSRGGKKSARLTEEEKGKRGSRGSVSSTGSRSPTIKMERSISTSSDGSSPPLLSQQSTNSEAPNHVIPELSLNYLNLNLSNLNGTASNNLANNTLANNNNNNSNNNNNNTSSNTPAVPNSLLQTPIMNNLSNNITNNFFNTNYSNQNHNNNSTDESYSFNLSSFSFANHDNLINNPSLNTPEQNLNSASNTNINSLFNKTPSNFIDSNPSTNNNVQVSSNLDFPSSNVTNSQPNNPGLHNSLNPYSSNPATTINYLYGTNTYYDNENLLDDLIKHLPPSKERSYELINRYINSVHILLPIVVNLTDFIKEHDRYWELSSNNKTSPESTSSSSISTNSNNSTNNNFPDFNYLQFYTLYFPILYASTISEFEEYDNLLLNQDINKYLKGFNKICQYYNYPHGLKTIPLLLGNVIIQSTSPNPSTMEMSQIIRYAKFLQMHKDPILTLRINDWEVVKFRRLLWWVIFGLDALTSHNFCLPPVCRFDDFNVLMLDEEEPIFNENGTIKEKKLNVSILSMNVKFKYDRILSELVYELHNGLSTNITAEKVNEIKSMIIDLFNHIHKAIFKMSAFYKLNPPTTVQEVNLINFIKNHSWSFVDRALMLLHKKILLRDPKKNDVKTGEEYEINLAKTRGGVLSLSQYEDTFGHILEANIINNFNNSSISQLKFNQFENFSYENLTNNLIPSILHNLNDFLKYNDFIKFGKFNWYVKRTIPLDSIILMFIIITVKFKYEFMTINELMVYVKLINKALFILNRKWYKNEKYKRMLSLTNLTWEFILKKYNIVNLINSYNNTHNIKNEINEKGKIEFFDYQVTGYMNMSELFNVMDVPQPMQSESPTKSDVSVSSISTTHNKDQASKNDSASVEMTEINSQKFFSNTLIQNFSNPSNDLKTELIQINEKIYYDLRNNFVDINDYCAFYSSLENILHELMDYIHKG